MSLVRQCELLNVPRSTIYYQRRLADAEELELMRRIDEIHLKWPFLGSRRIRDALRDQGFAVNRKRVQRLMRLMGLEALYPRPRTSLPESSHERYPYLLKGLSINRPNQVWAADITYIPMRRGFLYLVAIMDWSSRCVLSWRLSNTMDSDFCVVALQEALDRFGAPEIFNTDQGSQFTGEAFLKPLKERGIRISMDGRGRWLDNVFVERLWRSLKYEEVYLKAYADGNEARQSLAAWFEFYNHVRWHQSLDGQTPWQVYRQGDLALAA